MHVLIKYIDICIYIYIGLCPCVTHRYRRCRTKVVWIFGVFVVQWSRASRYIICCQHGKFAVHSGIFNESYAKKSLLCVCATPHGIKKQTTRGDSHQRAQYFPNFSTSRNTTPPTPRPVMSKCYTYIHIYVSVDRMRARVWMTKLGLRIYGSELWTLGCTR